MLKIAVLGASGRMGRALIELIANADDLGLVGAVTETADPELGMDAAEAARLPAAGVLLTDDRAQALHDAHVAIDFTLPAATVANVRACVETGTPLVIGTTGLEAEQMDAMKEASRDIPLVFGRNMSIGVNVFTDLVRRAATALGKDFDVEIGEAHHRHKVDAPSGTALALGEAIAGARGQTLDEVAIYARHGTVGPRVPGTIGFSVVRAGDIVGDHEVLFVAPEESVSLRHHARDRKTFARGALRAARWVAGQAPGFYGMADVLGLDDG
ncbi:MAG TPA: 4-hydroxy-tetrahydrodipicolinate reductase [Gammaproteobacteria bacterium]